MIKLFSALIVVMVLLSGCPTPIDDNAENAYDENNDDYMLPENSNTKNPNEEYFKINKKEFYDAVHNNGFYAKWDKDTNTILMGKKSEDMYYLLEGYYDEIPPGMIVYSPYTYRVIKINEITKQFGTIPFDGQAFGKNIQNIYTVILITDKIEKSPLIKEFTGKYPNEDISKLYTDQIMEHEINHNRTSGFTPSNNITYNLFRSELLADLLYLSELDKKEKQELLLEIKLRDAEGIIRTYSDDPKKTYYIEYLKIIKSLIEKYPADKISEKANEVKGLIEKNGEEWNSIEKMSQELNGQI